MIVDDRLEFADNLAVNTGGAGTYVLGDQVDLGTQRRGLGGDQALYLVMQVGATGLAGSTGTIQFQLVTADDAGLTTNVEVLAQSAAFSTTGSSATTTLAPGTRLMSVQIPHGLCRRFIGIRQVTATAATSGGTIDAFLVTDVAQWRAYDAPFQL